MSLVTRIKKIAHFLLPPIVFSVKRRIWPSVPQFEYAPDGWQTARTNGHITNWNVENVINAEKAKWDDFCRNLQDTGPLGFSHEADDLSVVRNISAHNVHMTYSYVLALAAHQKTTLLVLDWGGALGHYYQLGKTVLPGITLDFHCRELPLMVETGKLLNPEVRWYNDDSCLGKFYDLVMISGSLQYIEDWEDAIYRICPAAKEYFFLSRIPTVKKEASFVMIERIYGTEVMNQVLNQNALLQAVESTGLRLIREFVVYPLEVKNAPEDVEWCSWLFKREP